MIEFCGVCDRKILEINIATNNVIRCTVVRDIRIINMVWWIDGEKGGYFQVLKSGQVYGCS